MMKRVTSAVGLGLTGSLVFLAVAGTARAGQTESKAPPGIVIRDVWVRESTATRTVSSGYLTIENRTERAVSLIGVVIEGVRRAEFHDTAGDPLKATMRAVTAVRIPAHRSVQLEPGGMHLMLFGVSPPLVRDTTVTMTLTFDDKQTQTARAVVRPLGAMSIR
jgi:copper(I)-binding protein